MTEYKCLDCGWSTSRLIRINNPRCSKCDSSNTEVTEKEVEIEVERYQTYTPEDYRKVHKINMDIINGVPLEEIEGLKLEETLASTSEERAQRGQWGTAFCHSSAVWVRWGHNPTDSTRDVVRKCGVSLIKSYYDGEPEYF